MVMLMSEILAVTVAILGLLILVELRYCSGFASALIVGVFVGTYSSLFVASPVMVFFEKRSSRPKRK